MSTTQTQTTPAHIIIFEGKPFNNEVSTRDLQALIDHAEQAQFDLESECQRQYGIPVKWVTREQRYELSSQAIEHRQKRLEERGLHYHRCVDCGEVSGCLEQDCKKNEIECRVCHEGMRQSEWTMYHRKAAYRGDL